MEKFYTPEEIAEMLKTTRKTVYTWLHSGKLKAFKAGKMWRVSETNLNKFLNPPESKK